MMQRFVILTVFICACLSGHAQINLVLNPSFEDYRFCPTDWNQIKSAYYWSSLDTSIAFGDTISNPGCTSEFIHICGTAPFASAPLNEYFYQYPRTEQGMAQVYMYYDGSAGDTLSYQRDYLQGRLKEQLQSGQQYCVSFYVVLEEVSGYACDHIGAYFDDGSIDTTTRCGWPQTTHVPQVYQTGVITDTQNWTKVEGTFTANGTERFITLGNFFSGDATATVPGPSFSWWGIVTPGTCYLIDDVSVIATYAAADAGPDRIISTAVADSAWVGNTDGYLPCRWYKNGVLIDSNVAGFKVHPTATSSYTMVLDVCGNITRDTAWVYVFPVGVISPILGHITTYPNPAHNELHIDGLFAEATYTLRDITGRQIQQGTLTKGDNTIALHCTPGIYTMELTNGQDRQVVRVVVE